jgi:serine/threonine-protein kinase HipA
MATHRRRPTRRGLTPARNEAALDLIVAWHETPIGHLTHDGFEWRWKAVDEKGPPLVRRTTPGQLPTFIVSLLPEGWLESVLGDRDERAQLRSGRRYMSNIMIALSPKELAAVPADILDTRLAAYIEGGTFTGRYEDPWPWRAGKQLRGQSRRDLRAQRHATPLRDSD